jgi:endonuclease III
VDAAERAEVSGIEEEAMKKPVKASAKKAAKVRKVAKLREGAEQKRERAKEIYKRLRKAYPDAHCALNYRNPYELLVATILSAQCTDVRVNMVTPALFERYPFPDDLAAAKTEELEEMIRSTGFFRNKAKSLLGMSNAVVEQHAGRIPEAMDELVELPGVGRKTANVVLGNAFNKNIGVVVDTHVARVSGRLGLTLETDPIRIEQDLMELFPRKDWTLLSHLFIEHGRQICKAPTPKCELCMLNDICPSSRV